MKIQAALLREELARILKAQTEGSPPQPLEFPTELIERVVDYVLQQRRRGRTVLQCADELGVSKGRLHYWLYQRCRREAPLSPTRRPPSPLRPVQVAAEMVPVSDGVPERRYVLRSPAGWELRDLSLAELMELLRSLI